MQLTREYQTISANPPPYIVAHPSESNILEWHYILTGPPDTPYQGGQYWGTLLFPPEYPFAPPSIRMHTPSGRFQPSARLCLSISDFHPKSFNPAWEVSTILIGLMSFMTSDEMTTGSVNATEAQRKVFAARSRWWNSTGGGTAGRTAPGVNASTKGVGAVKAGDGGLKFRFEWPDLDKENWDYMDKFKIDPVTGVAVVDINGSSCAPDADALRRGLGGGASAVMGGGQAAREAGQGWVRRNKYLVVGMTVVGYVLLARVLGERPS
jgi:ubiquitin-conjugating enzyme E2 J2